MDETHNIARDCGKKTLFQFFIVLSLSTLFLSIVYFWGDVISAFLYMANIATFGGSFWGGVSVALVSMIVFVWASCTYFKISRKTSADVKSRTKWLWCLAIIMGICFLAWLMAFIGVLTIFYAGDGFNILHFFAYLVVHIPFILFCIVFINFVFLLLRF